MTGYRLICGALLLLGLCESAGRSRKARVPLRGQPSSSSTLRCDLCLWRDARNVMAIPGPRVVFHSPRARASWRGGAGGRPCCPASRTKVY